MYVHGPGVSKGSVIEFDPLLAHWWATLLYADILNLPFNSIMLV